MGYGYMKIKTSMENIRNKHSENQAVYYDQELINTRKRKNNVFSYPLVSYGKVTIPNPCLHTGAQVNDNNVSKNENNAIEKD